MKKRTLIFILISALILAMTVPAYALTSDASAVTEGPGVYSSGRDPKAPRILSAPQEEEKEKEADSTAVPSVPQVTEGATPLQPAEGLNGDVPLVETAILPEEDNRWEERVAADLLLEEEARPYTGELYHSKRYYSTSATLSINNLGEDDTLIRFFSPTDEHVFSVYLRKGEKTKVQIPGGNYYMKQAFGEKWYGMDDMFGNCGRYCECSIGTSRYFTIKRSGKYVISTMGMGDAFTKVEVAKEDF